MKNMSSNIDNFVVFFAAIIAFLMPLSWDYLSKWEENQFWFHNFAYFTSFTSVIIGIIVIALMGTYYTFKIKGNTDRARKNSESMFFFFIFNLLLMLFPIYDNVIEKSRVLGQSMLGVVLLLSVVFVFLIGFVSLYILFLSDIFKFNGNEEEESED